MVSKEVELRNAVDLLTALWVDMERQNVGIHLIMNPLLVERLRRLVIAWGKMREQK